MSTFSTHVLDTTCGSPAVGVRILLARKSADGCFEPIARTLSDRDGRAGASFPDLEAGIYRVSFDTGAYFTEKGIVSLYPEVQVFLEISAGCDHYHVPLLMSPFAYSTYRGR